MDANLPISISAGDFVRMSQRISELDKARIALHSENVSLKNRCGVLESENIMLNNSYADFRNEGAAQVRARDVIISELKSRLATLHQEHERLRASAVPMQPVEAGRMAIPAWTPLRIVSVGDSRTETAEDEEFSALSANDTDEHGDPSGPSPGPAPPGRYPDKIPEKDRDAIRTRMLRDRGPNGAAPGGSHEASEDMSGTTTPPASPQGELAAPGGSHEASEDMSGTTTPPASPQGELEEARPAADRPSRDVSAANGAVTSQLGEEEKGEAADEDNEETEDECADQHIETDTDESDDECDDDLPAYTPSAALGTLGGVQEPRDQDVGGAPREGHQQVHEDASQESSPSVAEDTSDRGLAPVKTECRPLPCATPGSKRVAPATAAIDPASSGNTVSEDGTPSPPTCLTAVSVKREGSLSPPRTTVSPEAPGSSDGSASSRFRYTHQLYSPSSTHASGDQSSTKDSTNPFASSESTSEKEAPSANRPGERDDSTGFKREPVGAGYHSHCTFCSNCGVFPSAQAAVAKCEVCPRILCRKCVLQKREEFPGGLHGGDVVFPADKCVCREKDVEFSRPRKGRDAQGHLLKCLLQHELSTLFRVPVNVEEIPGYLNVVTRDDMIDLGTMQTKMKVQKQYQSRRGQLMFRADLRRMWMNCWKFAGHTPESPKHEAAGIVRCTLILEDMIQKFYEAYMPQQELVVDEGSWQADQVRRYEEKFAKCTKIGSLLRDEHEPPIAAAEYEDDSDEETDYDEENLRLGATVVNHKRKLVTDGEDDDVVEAPLKRKPSVPGGSIGSNEPGLNRNLCVLASLGESMKRSSS